MVVGIMQEDDVDMLHLEPLEALLQRAAQPFAAEVEDGTEGQGSRKARIGRTRPEEPPDFRRDGELVPRTVPQRFAKAELRQSGPKERGGVEVADPERPGAIDSGRASVSSLGRNRRQAAPCRVPAGPPGAPSSQIEDQGKPVRGSAAVVVGDLGEPGHWSGVCHTRTSFHEGRWMAGLEIFDRIGGGDSFVSGLTYGLLSDLDLDVDAALAFGIAHGALAMTTPGDTSVATLAEVRRLAAGRSARVIR